MSGKPIGGGLYTAIITTFDQREEVDLGAFRAVLEHVVSNGVDGLVVAGTTGEAHALSFDERDGLWKTAVEEAQGRVPVVAGCGATTTREAGRFIRLAADRGSDAALVLTPWFGNPAPAEIERYYLELAESAPIPLILYHNPSHTHVVWPAESVAALARQLEGKAIGYKEATADLDRVQTVRDGSPAGFLIFAGPPHRRAEFSRAGALAAIDDVSNVIPAECAAAFRGDARQERYVAGVVECLRRSPNYIALLKAAMNQLGLPAGKPRRPRSEPGAEELAEIRRRLDG